MESIEFAKTTAAASNVFGDRRPHVGRKFAVEISREKFFHFRAVHILIHAQYGTGNTRRHSTDEATAADYSLYPSSER